MQKPPHNNILSQQENASTIAGGKTNFGANPNPTTASPSDEIARVYLEESNLTKTAADLFINNTHNINLEVL